MSEEELRQYCKDASNEIIKLADENEQLKSVLKEIREYIKENKDKYYRDWGEDDGSYDTYLDEEEINKLSEIIDKGIGEDK